MAGTGALLVAIFAFVGTSIAVSIVPPIPGPGRPEDASSAPPLCLPQLLTEATVVVEVDGVQECPRQADAGNELTEAVEDWIFRNNSFTDCSIVGGYRTVCEATGRRTTLKYRVNVTCGSELIRYTGNREAIRQKNREAQELREFIRQKPVLDYTFEGNEVQIRFFKGKKVHYSECTAGVYGSVDGRLDICFCPTTYREAVCSLPPGTGPCLAYFPRYFHNSSSGLCERFIYGGCLGNENNFGTAEECLATCRECPPGKSYASCGSSCPKTCANKDDTFACVALCKEGCFCADGFVEHEGGCVRPQGCPSVCEWDPEVGPCRARIPRWFYNSTAGECNRFFYGGCHGNPNNFESLGDCQQACARGRKDECPGDKVSSTCGSLCPLTCDSPPTCPELCVEGCFCPPGTVQLDASSDHCIPREACVRQGDCPSGKVFKTCGTHCPRTCQNKDDFAACATDCVSGCFCPDGQVELGDRCVNPDECPQTDCPNGKVFRECGSGCPTTCDTLGDTRLCSQACVPGCFCPPGTVERGDRCVHPRECECPEGMEYQQCGTACPLTCDNKDEVVACTLQCVQGCFCPRGLLEHKGRCVNATECPVEVERTPCPVGMEYQKCGTACPLTCDNKDELVVCTLQCVEGCFCPRGLVEHEGRCVSASECPAEAEQTPCPVGKEYQECGSACPRTCENKDDSVFCSYQCVQGCFCPRGHVENGDGCVPPENCP